jgi:hypothetical protein
LDLRSLDRISASNPPETPQLGALPSNFPADLGFPSGTGGCFCKAAPAFDSNEFKSNQLVSWGEGSKTVSYTDAKPSAT